MRIGTYNVLGLQGYPPAEAQKTLGGPETEATIAHFSAVFRELDCDILALQEGVAPRTILSVAETLGLNAATLPSPLHWPGHLLTRYPIRESRVFSHSAPDARARPFSRVAGAVLLEIAEGVRLWVVVLHLHPSLPDLREQEGAWIQERIVALQRDTASLIVLGDFNCPVTESIHQRLKALGFVNAMERVGGGIAATMDTIGVTTRFIDHIYLSPALAPSLTAARVVRDTGFRSDAAPREGVWVHSDHLPVIAELAMPTVGI